MQASDWQVDAFRSYQTYNYVNAAVTTFWIYDYIITLDDEFVFLRNARLRKTKVIYVLTRLLPFASRAVTFQYTLSSNPAPETCTTLMNTFSALETLVVLFAEVLFALRTYALWRRNRVVLALLYGGFIVATVGGIASSFLPIGPPMTVLNLPRSSVTGCFVVTPGASLAVTFAFLIALELELVTLNVTRAVFSRRETRGRLLETLVRHNIFYYACGLVFSVANVLMAVSTNYGGVFMLDDLQVYIHAIMATRMHRMLWIDSEHERFEDSQTTIAHPE
ncbi:hypothetical protein CONPUDRAFT_161003 [Coniophora puteana RWD-64-598 SS2]|uniref:DUF6533 domain-containing protein n=1 Tax=Coniophora puteana (strain RWD-64-598) TaxID=741705 RepID=A0A5M3N548_CONPW|nr:uncharacterized protein CONPUDRAFT_161003 [Coniophora puteana RWD-64-598 SS2]EIW86184.1 hypothetical protein CONPUDRAFT_161003 [Coniophora puteana RWD-64-598 SS2]